MFQWIGYKNLAIELAKDHKDESKTRTSISRFYYFIFNKAKLYALNNKITNYKGISHADLIYLYKNHKDPDYNDIGDLLRELRDLRNSADYDAGKILAIKDLQSTEAKVKEIENLLSP